MLAEVEARHLAKSRRLARRLIPRPMRDKSLIAHALEALRRSRKVRV